MRLEPYDYWNSSGEPHFCVSLRRQLSGLGSFKRTVAHGKMNRGVAHCIEPRKAAGDAAGSWRHLALTFYEEKAVTKQSRRE